MIMFTRGFEPGPLCWQPGILPNRPCGRHNNTCLKRMSYKKFQNFKELAENLQAV